MRTYTWDEYYEKFYDWAESTQIRNLSALTSLGSADEVGEIIIELQSNESASNRLLKKAVEAKLEFSTEHLIEFLYANDNEIVISAVWNSAKRFTAEDIENLYGNIDDEIITKLCSEYKLPLPRDLRETGDFTDDFTVKENKKHGFFATLFAALGMSSSTSSTQPKHNGKCNGDCANCPPHYGYRYGRWYYGHCHSHGCEFGGNNGNGGID